MATCLDVAGTDYPTVFQGRSIVPCEGYSMMPILRGGAFEREVLYWEHEGNRAVRRGKWKLVCKYPGGWELYDVIADRTELNDLSQDYPDVVDELSALYDKWASRCSVMEWSELLELRRQQAGES
jgi:arylsulfatase